MFDLLNHATGLEVEGEILFSTNFDYLFPDAARSSACLVPDGPECTEGLKTLGTEMAGDTGGSADFSDTPAVYTYFGQFIDHDTTARTDREHGLSQIGNYEPVDAADPDDVVVEVRNGRRPDFDLDSVFGESPALAAYGTPDAVTSQTQKVHEADLRLRLFRAGDRRDVPREGREAVIPDARNDENLNLSQLQFAMMAFHNAVMDAQPSGSDVLRHVRARQLCRWAFQFVVVNDWLPTVCDQGVVADTLANGPRFLGAVAGRPHAFMPLEYSVAAFRFAHSMVRPEYQPNAGTAPRPINQLLGFASNAQSDDYFDVDDQLKEEFVIDWDFYAGTASTVQMARKIDTKIAAGLGTLPFEGRVGDPVLGNLARANLLRGKKLCIPTAQAMSHAFRLRPLSADQLTDGEDSGIADVLVQYGFHKRTPLWYYVLREAAVQHGGQRLGELGSRIVAETIISFVKQDPNSYLANRDDVAVNKTFVDVIPGSGGQVRQITDLLEIAGVHG